MGDEQHDEQQNDGEQHFPCQRFELNMINRVTDELRWKQTDGTRCT